MKMNPISTARIPSGKNIIRNIGPRQPTLIAPRMKVSIFDEVVLKDLQLGHWT